MFTEFFQRRRVQSYVSAVGPSLSSRIAALSPVERSATLAVGNAFLMAIAHDSSSRGIVTAPDKVDRKLAQQIIDTLSRRRSEVVKAVEKTGGSISKQAFDQATREALAFDLMALTMSTSVSGTPFGDVVRLWSELAAASRNAQGALKVLVAYSKATGTSPLPAKAGKNWSADEVVLLASQAPPFVTRTSGTASPR